MVTWTAIFEKNHRARHTLEGGRAGLPVYLDKGRLECPALLAIRGQHLPHAEERDWEEITEYLNRANKDRPLAPVHQPEDFAHGRRWPGLAAEDFIVKRVSGRLCGLVAVHDVRAIRQVCLQHLPWWLRALRKLGARRFVSANRKPLGIAYATCFAVEGGDISIGRELLHAARSEAARRGLGWLCICLHEADPQISCLRGMPALPFHGRLYEIHQGQSAQWPVHAPVIEAVAL